MCPIGLEHPLACPFIFFDAKTDFGAYLGTFLAPLDPRGEVRGGENVKIEHFGKSS
jgi:hypothetical protein